MRLRFGRLGATTARGPDGRPDREARAREVSLLERALIDAVVDSYAGWREDSAALRLTYQRWKEASTAGRSDAFAAHARALDREQRSGELYAAIVGHYHGVRRRLRTTPGAVRTP